ncbi:MAG: preprotein translocase subunit SecG [Deltaproteobacteria bacterium]|nr:preprotein translocase subunit SecG [Deltaproteobacteria bacterium]
MGTLLIFIHILVCLALIMIVLLQTGKGASMGAAFGGSSQTIFGSSGASTFLTKLTTIVAVVFMLTSLLLAFLHGPGSSSSVVSTPGGATPQQTAPAKTPAATPPAMPPANPAPINK